MNIKDILKPSFPLFSIVILQLSIYALYAIDVFKSYRINFLSDNLDGILNYIVSFAILILTTSFFSRTLDHEDHNQLTCSNPKRIFVIIYFFFFLSMIGFIRLSANVFSAFGILQMPDILLRSRQLDYITTGSFNTTLSIFLIGSLILLGLVFNPKDKKHVFILLFNLFFLFVYSSFLSSRILFIQGLLFFLIIYIKRFHFEKKINIKKVLMWTLIAISALIITSGYRDYNQEGKDYTDSVLDWGTTRITDYFISTTNISFELFDYLDKSDEYTFPKTSFEILGYLFPTRTSGVYSATYWRQTINPMEYNNMGFLFYFFSDYRFYSYFFLFVLGLLYCFLWNPFTQNNLFGLMFYPIFYYNILESWRIYYLGTALTETLLIILFGSFILIRNCFSLTNVIPDVQLQGNDV